MTDRNVIQPVRKCIRSHIGSSDKPSPFSRTAAACFVTYCLLLCVGDDKSCPGLKRERIHGGATRAPLRLDLHANAASRVGVDEMSGCGGAAWIKFAGNVRSGVSTFARFEGARSSHSDGFSEHRQTRETARVRHQLVALKGKGSSQRFNEN